MSYLSKLKVVISMRQFFRVTSAMEVSFKSLRVNAWVETLGITSGNALIA